VEQRRKNQVKYQHIKERNKVGKIGIKLKNNMETITIVAFFGMGVAVGLYISSQIDNNIDKNIKK